MAMTWAEKMIAQGRKEGKREGKKEGIEEGRRHVRQIVLDLLSERFGAVPDAVREQLEAESVDRLRFLAKRGPESRIDRGPRLGVSRSSAGVMRGPAVVMPVMPCDVPPVVAVVVPVVHHHGRLDMGMSRPGPR